MEKCSKTKHGLYCELTLNIHKNFQYYTRYTPINYKGTIWKAENVNQVLLKSTTGHWEILYCEEEEEEDYYNDDTLADFLDCSTKTYDNPCIRNLESDNTNEILSHCNFTTQHHVPDIIRTDLGILINSEDALIKELSPNDKSIKQILPKKTPVQIVT